MAAKLCPKCGNSVIEDAWEEIEVLPNENIKVNAFPAWICSKHCGYYEEIKCGE